MASVSIPLSTIMDALVREKVLRAETRQRIMDGRKDRAIAIECTEAPTDEDDGDGLVVDEIDFDDLAEGIRYARHDNVAMAMALIGRALDGAGHADMLAIEAAVRG